MPNYVTNILTFEGDNERIEKLLEYIEGENGSIDFNKIVPMPKSYENLTSGSITDQAIAVYMAKEKNDYSKIDAMLSYTAYKNLNLTREALVDYLIEKYNATVELGRRYIENYEKYGATTWYDWCNINWGTKWNACEPYYDESTHTLTFDTAWSGVPELILKISEKHPLVKIQYKYADEDFGYNVGSMDFFGGVVDNQYYPEGGSAEAKELASEILGWSDEDFEDDYEEDED